MIGESNAANDGRYEAVRDRLASFAETFGFTSITAFADELQDLTQEVQSFLLVSESVQRLPELLDRFSEFTDPSIGLTRDVVDSDDDSTEGDADAAMPTLGGPTPEYVEANRLRVAEEQNRRAVADENHRRWLAIARWINNVVPASAPETGLLNPAQDRVAVLHGEPVNDDGLSDLQTPSAHDDSSSVSGSTAGTADAPTETVEDAADVPSTSSSEGTSAAPLHITVNLYTADSTH